MCCGCRGLGPFGVRCSPGCSSVAAKHTTAVPHVPSTLSHLCFISRLPTYRATMKFSWCTLQRRMLLSCCQELTQHPPLPPIFPHPELLRSSHGGQERRRRRDQARIPQGAKFTVLQRLACFSNFTHRRPRGRCHSKAAAPCSAPRAPLAWQARQGSGRRPRACFPTPCPEYTHMCQPT